VKRERLKYMPLLVAVGIGMTSAGVASASDVCPKMGGILKTVDMHYASVDPTKSVNPIYLMHLVYDALLNVEHDLTITPGLAEAMPEQVDGTTFVFKLRSGVKFHDGTDFDAAAVKFNAERLMSGTVSSPFTGTWKDFVKEVTVMDPLTVKFELSKPWPAFLWEAASNLRFASPAKVQELGDDYGIKGAAGTGPFMLKKLDPKQGLDVVRNPNYYRTGEPCLDGIQVRTIKSGSVRILSLKKGDLDVINTFPESQFPQLKGVDDIIIGEGVATTFTVLPLNTRHPALADKRVRQAIQYAVDGKVLIDSVYGGEGAVVESIFPPWHKGFLPAKDLSPIRQNVEKAKQLLAEAGYGPGGKSLKFTLMTGSGGAHVQRGVLIQAQLKDVGITLNLENKKFGQILPDMYKGNYDMVLWQINGGTPLKDFVWNLYSKSAGNNVMSYNKKGGYQNPRADELVEIIAATENPETVEKELQELQSILFEDLPFVYLNFRNHRTARHAYVKGFNTAKLKGREDMRRVWLDK
jgi:ABC-type transport system substrate-binding protein